MLEMVVKDGNIDRVDGVENGMNWKGKNVMEGPEWCQNDVGVSEMDLVKFYMTPRG